METDETGKQISVNVYGTNLISRKTDSDTVFYLYNGHADVTALIGESGNIMASYRYDAFGNIIEHIGIDSNITYAGYQYDKETDLYYLNARYYDSKIVRFMTEDTYTGEEDDPLSLNLYTYCHNEPVMYDDPTGHKANRVLDYGDKGDMVKAIQEKLLGLDYSLGGYKATGNFVGCTQSAVKEFQKDYGLPVTGVVDNRTMNVLCTAYSLRNDNDHQKVYNQIELLKKNSKAGDIPGEAILLSQDTYKKTIKNITTAKNSTSDPKNTVVHTKVVNNEVKVVSVEKKETNQTKPQNGNIVGNSAIKTLKDPFNAIGTGLSLAEERMTKLSKSISKIITNNAPNNLTVKTVGEEIKYSKDLLTNSAKVAKTAGTIVGVTGALVSGGIDIYHDINNVNYNDAQKRTAVTIDTTSTVVSVAAVAGVAIFVPGVGWGIVAGIVAGIAISTVTDSIKKELVK